MAMMQGFFTTDRPRSLEDIRLFTSTLKDPPIPEAEGCITKTSTRDRLGAARKGRRKPTELPLSPAKFLVGTTCWFRLATVTAQSKKQDERFEKVGTRISGVSRAFVIPGQRRLFRRLTLATGTIVSLSENLSQSPHFCSYVRELTLNIHIRPDDIQAPLAKTIPLELKSALISLLSLPTVSALALVRCSRVPAGLISRALASYKDVVLHVKAIDVEHEGISIGTPKPRKPNPLRHLALLDYSPAATPSVHALLLRPEMKAATAHLQHLKIALPAELHRDGLNIISEYAPSLRQLIIPFYRSSSFAGMFSDLPLTSVTARFASALYPSASAADEALGRLAHLREVRFIVVCESSRAPDKDEVHKQIRDNLPRTNAAGILSFPKGIPQTALSHFSVC
ncbi:hypothetical protein C8R45DRAFT_1083505 [Mycena sanguinolenta]|nr:hypothetical protein C8R45DRAFT_1083505 [Mycena sanguinolenta]